MSDAMKDGEIEDVLSSIRRLVSQETPGAASAPAGAAAPGRLLLTAALRIVPGTPRAAAPEAAPEETPAPRSQDAPGPSSAERRASLEQTIAELEAAVSQYDEEWEPDGTEPPQRVEEPAPEMPASSPVPVASAGGAQQHDAAKADNVRPFIIPASSRVPRADRPQADSGPATSDEGGEGEEASPPLRALAPHELPEDEDALRELVARLVREELHGPLGERITRNVRKLVRSEIARALASRDLI
ncbi:hypothetical protein [Alkalilacustris brevis]|uniref:hypothetical protein n=1 Tax=Alkalilacustris brevis TaxID=2026338 RepID=UPI000E0D7945|nr:hypothetical protein [Alkalilacustris brevis]